MKRSRIIFLCLLLAGSLAHGEEPLKLCYEDAYNFPWLTKNGQGLNNKLVDMAALQSGIKVVQVAFPWKRCLSNIATGEVAGGLAASYSEERAKFAVYPTTPDGKLDPSRRLKTDGYSLYRVKGTAAHWDGRQFVDLTGRIGSQLGYSSSAELRKLGAAVYESNDNPEKAMKHLLAGDLELLALMTFEGDEQLNNPELARKVEKIASPFTEKPYFVIFNKDFYNANRNAVEEFWAGLAAARESAQFKRLLREETSRIAPVPVAK